MRKLIWVAAIIVLPSLGTIFLYLFKIPIPNEKYCLIITGTVADIYEAGERDIVFTLKEQSKAYYINRGLERGLDLQVLRTGLLNRPITIKYPKHFTGAGHISKLESAGETVYTELESK